MQTLIKCVPSSMLFGMKIISRQTIYYYKLSFEIPSQNIYFYKYVFLKGTSSQISNFKTE